MTRKWTSYHFYCFDLCKAFSQSRDHPRVSEFMHPIRLTENQTFISASWRRRKRNSGGRTKVGFDAEDPVFNHSIRFKMFARIKYGGLRIISVRRRQPICTCTAFFLHHASPSMFQLLLDLLQRHLHE